MIIGERNRIEGVEGKKGREIMGQIRGKGVLKREQLLWRGGLASAMCLGPRNMGIRPWA